MDICAPQLSEDIRDELMHWTDAHTALSILHRGDALARLYAAQPLDFAAQPLPQHTFMPLSRPLMRLRPRDGRLCNLRCAGAALPQLSPSVAARTAVTRQP